MSATELVCAGDFRPVRGKVCPQCGHEGEWPGQPCPTCCDESPAPATPPKVEGGLRESLDELAAIANAEHARVHLAGRELVEAAVRAGEALLRARDRVERGHWITWATEHLDMHITTAYRYMRMAEYRKEVLASDVRSIEASIQLLADHPRRGHGPRRYSDADKADWVALADQIGIKPAARALGVSCSTIHKWTSPNSASRGKTLVSRQVTTDRIERMAEWLVSRFGGYDYPERVTGQVRVDAAAALGAIFAERDEVAA